jgi:hypothetical protein
MGIVPPTEADIRSAVLQLRPQPAQFQALAERYLAIREGGPYREGAFRQVTIAPKIWFHHTGNAAEAENRLTFEKLLKVSSLFLEGSLERALSVLNALSNMRLSPNRLYLGT